jgi:hypothetical protein
MIRNQCLTGGTEHGGTDQIMQRSMRPEIELYRFPRRLDVPCTESSSIRGVGQQRHSRCARTVGEGGGKGEGRKRPHQAILEDISSGSVLSFLIGRRCLDDGRRCPAELSDACKAPTRDLERRGRVCRGHQVFQRHPVQSSAAQQQT